MLMCFAMLPSLWHTAQNVGAKLYIFKLKELYKNKKKVGCAPKNERSLLRIEIVEYWGLFDFESLSVGLNGVDFNVVGQLD